MSAIYLTRNGVETIYNEVLRFAQEDQPTEIDRMVVLGLGGVEVRVFNDGEGGVAVEIEQSSVWTAR